MDHPPRRRLAVHRLVATFGGFALLAGGLAGFDWRIAAIVCGALLLGSAVIDALAVARKP